MSLVRGLEDLKERYDKNRQSHKIQVLKLDDSTDMQTVRLLMGSSVAVIDEMAPLLEELYEIRHPADQIRLADDIARFRTETAGSDPMLWGNWVHYPWANKLVHFPPAEIWREIRTARNKTLVTAEEQEMFWNFRLGIMGLSVGQSAALTIARCAGCRQMKLADPDILAPSNLNRLNGDLSHVGVSKVALVTQQILALDPYYDLQVYPEGITLENMDDFFASGFPLDAVIDAADGIPMKVALRKAAKKHRVPVLMATDLGDGVLMDIERYDREDNLPIFDGRVEEDVQVRSKMDYIRTGLKIISPEYISPRMFDALSKIGKEIVTHPQLGSSAILSGAVLSYVIRKLSLGEELASGRIHIDLERFFNPETDTDGYEQAQRNVMALLKQQLGME